MTKPRKKSATKKSATKKSAAKTPTPIKPDATEMTEEDRAKLDAIESAPQTFPGTIHAYRWNVIGDSSLPDGTKPGTKLLVLRKSRGGDPLAFIELYEDQAKLLAEALTERPAVVESPPAVEPLPTESAASLDATFISRAPAEPAEPLPTEAAEGVAPTDSVG